MESNKYNVVSINGSPHGKYGNTQALINQLIQKLENENLILDRKNYYLMNSNIQECRGCTNCMRRGKCPMREHDDIDKIVNELLKAEIVIFASPIYVLSVTGYFKKFIDRTAYITHRLILEGKKGIFVLSSQGMGDDMVAEYMRSVMEAMGMNIIGGVIGNTFFHKVFVNKKIIDEEIDGIAYKIKNEMSFKEEKVSEQEIKRREKFKSLMQQKDISRKLFKEDYDYWKRKDD